MNSVGYLICFIVSMLVLLYMAHRGYESVDTYYWTILVLLPIINLAYWFRSVATTAEAVKQALCFIYLDSTVLPVIFIFSMRRSLGFKPKKWSRILGYGIAAAHLLMVIGCMNNDLYYRNFELVETGFGYAIRSESGPLKLVHYLYLAGITIVILINIASGYFRKGTYSRKTLTKYTAITIFALAIYTVQTILNVDYSVLPFLYAAASVIIAFDYNNIRAHNITGLISSQYDSKTTHGYVAVSFDEEFIGCNARALEILPHLHQQRVDGVLDCSQAGGQALKDSVEHLKNGQSTSLEYSAAEKTYILETELFSVRNGGTPYGYLIDIRDATEEKRTLQILSDYNNQLNREVEEKTQNISAIQHKVVVGLANMIENRDDNTGGHIKRTSDVVRILVDEMLTLDKNALSPQFARDIIKAAPMHDLGKLHIDSSILCKPGKLTDEEYTIMKTHPVKSGEMVMILLKDVEEDHFVKTAFNIARYHHERWDGKGYPEGLKREQIPLEARIMAVADVYDALVSERCYKKPMSFEQANEIMCENMGTQFAPEMDAIFRAGRERLEAYYRNAKA